MDVLPDEMIFDLPSDFRYLGAVDAALQDLAREFSFSEDALNDVSTALVEACSNAIEHGNKFSKERRVRVAIRFSGNRFSARVTDEGDGFDFESGLDDDSPPDPLSERGRGLMIMKAFTDELTYRREAVGLSLELVKICDIEEGEAGVAD